MSLQADLAIGAQAHLVFSAVMGEHLPAVDPLISGGTQLPSAHDWPPVRKWGVFGHMGQFCHAAGGVPGMKWGYALYGREGTLVLDLDAGKLLMGTKAEGGELKEVALQQNKMASWRVRPAPALPLHDLLGCPAPAGDVQNCSHCDSVCDCK